MTAAALCWHCEQPLQHAFRARTPDGERDACCSGCAAAIETIHGLGLADYYRFRGDERPAPPDPAEDRQLALFRLDAITRPFIRQQGDSLRISLILEGIHCAACVWLIEHAMRDAEGVRAVSLNLATLRLELTWDPARISLYDLATRLQQLGYTPRLPVRAAQEAEQSGDARWMAIRLLVAGLGAMQSMMYATALYVGAFDGMEDIYRDFFRYAGLAIATPVVFFSGWPFLIGASRALSHRRVTMDVPVTLALLLGWGGSLLATVLEGEHVYFESISMFVFFLLTSRWLEQRQRLRVSQLLNRLQETLPLAVTRQHADGSTEMIPARLVEAGDQLLLQQGDIVPVDAQVLGGDGQIEQAVLTGEALPVPVTAGDAVAAGATLLEGQLLLCASGRVDESRVARIGQLVEQAQAGGHDAAQKLDIVASRFIIAVLVLAAATLIMHWQAGQWRAFEHMLAVLVVTCPCALALAAPLSIAAGVGRGLDAGLLIARPDQFLLIPEIDRLVFDKTGTLTHGDFELASVTPLAQGLSLDQLKGVVAGLEQNASHPVARALSAMAAPVPMSDLEHRRNGVQGRHDGHCWRVGPAPVMDDSAGDATRVCLYRNGQPVLEMALRDRVRADASTTLSGLGGPATQRWLLSGDARAAVKALADRLGMDHWRAQLSAEQKRDAIAALQQQGHRVLMVGDGVNDAPALVQADVSVAMADSASLARQAASAYLLRDELAPVSTLFLLARHTRRILRQNIGWALAYNALAVPFAMAGWVPPWLAAIGMSASSLIVTLNAARLGKWKL